MSEHTLTLAITLDLPREDVFAFFADAGNLERITPPELSFNIVSPQPIVLAEGSLIDYQLKIFGIPLKWRTEISSWNPPFDFTDRQLKGPYSQWIHRHTFTDLGPARTLIEDEVRYRLPLEPFGEIAHFIVRGELDRIFDFRQTTVAKILVD
jgi:ligand-binding SRPBCC domain-containing protein